jgi:hypothetical protein
MVQSMDWIATILGIWCIFSPKSFVKTITLGRFKASRYALIALRVAGLLMLTGALLDLTPLVWRKF